jgi:hypothetical protein
MIFGSASTFALESKITKAYDELGLRALGYFVVYLADHRFGIIAEDATLLACSFDEVSRRIAARGTHTASFATVTSAESIARALRDAMYAENQENAYFFGISQPNFCEQIYSHHLIWAPDGDEAFDDGSYVLHFDLGSEIRLIGFKCTDNHYPESASIRDVRMKADEFYEILSSWKETFLAAWATFPKSKD